MKVDLDQKLVDPRGNPFTDGATVAVAAYNALSAPQQTDATQPPEQALARYRLLQTIAKGGVQELTAENIAEIKKRAVLLGVIAFGALCDALEGKLEAVPIAGPPPEQKQGTAS